MKHNRSLKEINLPKSFYREKENAESISSPKNFLPVHYIPTHTKHQYDLKTAKNTQSQKNLFNFSTISATNPLVSPKYNMPAKNTPPSVLTPVNKNLSTH